MSAPPPIALRDRCATRPRRAAALFSLLPYTVAALALVLASEATVAAGGAPEPPLQTVLVCAGLPPAKAKPLSAP